MASVVAAQRYLFVGERRSNRAIAMGVTWENGRLAGHTLFFALREIGLDPDEQQFMNVFHDDGTLDDYTLQLLRESKESIVALGRIVQRELTRAGIPHTAMIHPAARGAIRLSSRYRAHVAAVLCGTIDAPVEPNPNCERAL